MISYSILFLFFWYFIDDSDFSIFISILYPCSIFLKLCILIILILWLKIIMKFIFYIYVKKYIYIFYVLRNTLHYIVMYII